MTVHTTQQFARLAIQCVWTTEAQLELIKKELAQRHNEVQILVQEAWEHADCTDQIDNDLDGLWCALQNICSDLEIEGFEMS